MLYLTRFASFVMGLHSRQLAPSASSEGIQATSNYRQTVVASGLYVMPFFSFLEETPGQSNGVNLAP